MFARISGSLAGDLVVDNPAGSSDNYPANVWIWSEQTIQAQRRRFNCAPFQSIHGNNSSDCSSSHPRHRTALICRAARRSKQPHAPVRRAHKYGGPAGAHRHSSFTVLHGSTIPSSSQGTSSSWQTAAQQHKQQQQQLPVDPEQLTACINAATQYHQLEALCNTFLHNASFSSRHAALVISRLHQVHSRSRDSQLLLLELLAAKLAQSAASSGSKQQLQPQEVAAVCWGFARAGYQPDAGLLQQLLEQFWSGVEQQQQQQQQQPLSNQHQQQQLQEQQQQGASATAEPLAMLIAGLAGTGFRDSVVWNKLKASSRQHMGDLSPAGLQQLAWGLATAQQADDAMIAVLAAAVDRMLERFSAEGLVQVTWCLHVMGCEDTGLFERVSQQMVKNIAAQAAVGGSSSSISRSAGNQQRLQQQQQVRLAPQQQEARGRLQAGQQAGSSSSSSVVAALCNAAASQAYNVLEKYDPLLSTLLLYKKLQPAHSC